VQALRNWFLSLWRRWFLRPSPSPVVETVATIESQEPPPPANRQQRRARARRVEWEGFWIAKRTNGIQRRERRRLWRRYARSYARWMVEEVV
jgi:hypothetical protein